MMLACMPPLPPTLYLRCPTNARTKRVSQAHGHTQCTLPTTAHAHRPPPHTKYVSGLTHHLPLRSVSGWVTMETIINALNDNELTALDKYHENNPSPLFQEERDRLRELAPDDSDELGAEDGS